MARLGNYCVGFAGFALLAITGVPGNADDDDSHHARRPTKVEIVSPVPLPVTGSFGIAGTANVNVTNVPSVNVANTPSVKAEVVNTPDAPIPVRDTRMTTSLALTIGAGQNSAEGQQIVPTCPPGTEFLVTAVTAAPDFFGNANMLLLPSWGVRVNVAQKSSGGASSKPILLYGNGPQHVSVTLPAGQPSFFDVIVQILNGPSPAGFTFVIHSSGYCGVASVAP
jgi:hypothetical protein